MGKLRANPKFSIEKGDGTPASGWKVHCYIAGTTTNKDTYTDNTEGTPNANPVILDARGEADIWFSGTYKIVLKDDSDVTVWTVDNYGEGEDQTQTGNYNLVKNGSFETDEVTSGEPDNWTIVDYSDAGSGAGVHAIDATDQFHGLNSLKFTSLGDGGGYATSDYFEVEEAKAVNFDWNMKSSVATVRNVVDVLWYTAAKSLISTTNLYDDSTTNLTSWGPKYSQATPPSTARYAQLRVYGCHSSDATAGSTWYDNIEVGPNLARRHSVNTFTQTQTWSKGADVASANALTLGIDGNYFDITGTTAITSIGTLGIGTVIKLHFDGILTLTNHATDLILPGGANITTAAGDEAEVVEYASGDWRCVSYQRYDGFTPDKVAGYDRGVVVHLQDDVNNPVLVAVTDLTKNTWESVGPTGSGATNIWSDLDVIPATATHAIFNLYASASDTTTISYASIKCRENGSVVDIGHQSGAFTRSFIAGSSNVSTRTLFVPLDGNNVFEAEWDSDSPDTTEIASIYLDGWVE